MKKLNKEFIGRGEVRGFKFTQIRATKRAFLYEVDADGVICYEVFKRMINKQYDCESYPGSNSFGLWAWHYMDLTKAMNKFKTL